MARLSFSLLDILVKKHHLAAQLRVMRKTMLLGQGDFVRHLMDSLRHSPPSRLGSGSPAHPPTHPGLQLGVWIAAIAAVLGALAMSWSDPPASCFCTTSRAFLKLPCA